VKIRNLPKLTSVDEMFEGTAHFIVSRRERDYLLSPAIYAAFDHNGRCRYVGQSLNGIVRPLDKAHHRLSHTKWARVLIWRVEGACAGDLNALEAAAIRKFAPDLNRTPTNAEYLRPSECAQALGVSSDFILGEIKDGKIPAVRRSTANGRMRYWVNAADWLDYVATHWQRKTA
jgi:hypothetical protein